MNHTNESVSFKRKRYTLTNYETRQILLTHSGEYQIDLVGQGAEVTIDGRWLVQRNDELNVHVTVHHQAPHTQAKIVLKAVGTDQAQVTLKGKIIVDRNCPGVGSHLEERVLLISDQARAEVVPEMEILTDDVTCSHATSISNLDEIQLFYLMSRGVTKNTAKKLIVNGCLSD